MTKSILIPTDFSVKLLKLIREALENNPDEQVDIVLAHRISLSYSITELLFFSKSEMLRSLETREFKDSCQIILNKYESQIHSFRIELFTGNNQQAFRNFLEGNRIDEIYRPSNYQLKLKHKSSLDILPFLTHELVTTIDIDLGSKEAIETHELEQLADLFFQPANGVKNNTRGLDL